MGVTGLLGLLKSIHKPCNLKIFAGQVIGVDGYGWLHRGAVACAIELTTGKHTTKFVDFAMHRVRMLIHFGVIPYIVFDGDRLPSKASTEASRRARRKESKANGLQLLSMGKASQAYQELQKAVDITPEMARQFIEALKHAGVKYVVAPYEADSQLVYLEKKGIINGILSEDSDLLVFGAKCLLTKLDQYGECIMIKRDNFTACREVSLVGWTNSEFRTMAILSGCDYLEGIPKMGLKTAHRMVRKYKTIDRIIRGAQLEGKFRIPPGYLDNFIQAEKTFLYQWVYCPDSRCLVNLTPPESRDQVDGLNYIGEYVEPEIAVAVARGDLNPMSKEQILLDPKWTENLWTPKSSVKSILTGGPPGKPLDAFFKPKRTPLAELDPNSFTPSPSQQQVLDQGVRPWSISAAPARYSLPQTSTPAEWERELARQRVSSAPNRAKRQRLCSDPFEVLSSNSANGERSRFFTSVAPESSPSIGPLSRAKKSKQVDLHIWSDDSIEDAMASMAEISRVSPRSKKSKIPVFSDTPHAAGSTLPTKELPLEPSDDPLTIHQSRLSANLIRGTNALRARFSFTQDSAREAALPGSRLPRRASPSTTSKPRALHTTQFTKHIGEYKTPNRSNPLTVPKQLKQAATQTTQALSTTLIQPEGSWSPPPVVHPRTPKGSEDTLLVPDSDVESPCQDRTPLSTPRSHIIPSSASPTLQVPATPSPSAAVEMSAKRRGFGAVDVGADTNPAAANVIEGAETDIETLRLRRFVFGARA